VSYIESINTGNTTINGTESTNERHGSRLRTLQTFPMGEGTTLDAKGGYTVSTRTELLGKTINARLAVSQVVGAIEANPVASILLNSHGERYVDTLRRIEAYLVELEGELSTSGRAI
jgi:hypothetical protein